MPARLLAAVLLACIGMILPAAVHAQPGVGSSTCASGGAGETCGAPHLELTETTSLAVPAQGVLLFFWGVGCPRCEEARTIFAPLKARHPNLRLEAIEVRTDEAGRLRFANEVKRLAVQAPGIPMFVLGQHAVVGFGPTTLTQLEALLGGTEAAEPPTQLELPIFGVIDSASTSFALFTVLVGLADGVNPCAMYVLLVLLSILARAKSKRRALLFGCVFVLMSGAVYWAFMAAWLGVFLVVGLSLVVTRALGGALLVMGLINLKELIWFKQGPSLMIPESAKRRLFPRMRALGEVATLPAALLGIVALAFLVNLIELACTIGLPAMYTRLLSMRGDLGPGGRIGYLLLYNVAYIVPMGAIVFAYAVVLERITFTERAAKVLKGLSGALLLVFGGALLFGRPL